MSADVRQQMVELLPRLRRFAYGLTGSLDDADDTVQAACERALSRLDQFVPGTRLDSWMFQIVRNIWIDKMRYKTRRKVDNDPEALDRVAFDARIVEQVVARNELEIVRREVAKLPEEQRVALMLVSVDGMTYQQAADVVGVPIGTVMSRLARARKKLAAAIEPGSGGSKDNV